MNEAGPSFEDAPIRAAEGARAHFSKFGEVSAIYLEHDGAQWILRVVFDKPISLDQRLPSSYKQLPVRFDVDSFVALGRR